MKLPAADAAYLTERRYVYSLHDEGAGGGGFLIIKNFDVSGGGFRPSATDLMIRIPAQYPMTPLDMWYCDPPIRMATGQFAQASEVMEAYLNRTWQRFSRHLNGTWRPGIDSIRSFLTLIQRELQGKG